MTKFLKFSNAYKNEKYEDFTNIRIRIDNIADYEIFDRKYFKDANYSETMRRDLGDIAFGIVVRYKRGEDYSERRVYFWTKQQRDATMTYMDEFFGLFETVAQITTPTL